MTDLYLKYRNAELPVPERNLVWEMYGAGLENFGKDGSPVERELVHPGPDELLVRTDAVGICFSDVKLIGQGPSHPRITGRDLVAEPVVPGHEVSITIIRVGDNLKQSFKPGERYIVQADVFYQGKSMAYGYVLPGAMQQYGLIGPEVLQGDEGCYLLPMQDSTGYVEAALAEPWACVVAAYRIEQRRGIKQGGKCWIYNTGTASNEDIQLSEALSGSGCPAICVTSGVGGSLLSDVVKCCSSQEADFIKRDHVKADQIEPYAQEVTGGSLFDDIIVIGTPSVDEARELAKALGKGGLMNVMSSEPLSGAVEIDVGRVHYDCLSVVGSTGPDVAMSYDFTRQSELLSGGACWFVGAAGPMGQMHVQRAVGLDSPPSRILCTDIDDSRMQMLKLRVEKEAAAKGIDIQFVNPGKLAEGELGALIRKFTDGMGFDDIVMLVPVAALIEQAAPYLADFGVMNIFAGLPRGTKAMLPISDCYLRQVRYIGSSGSKLSDLEDTLHLAEEGKLSTVSSAAAIGGMNAMSEGVDAVKTGRFPGKTVIFPQFPDVPLTALTDLKQTMPAVYEKLRDGMFWTLEAEEEFFSEMLASGKSGARTSPAPRITKALKGKVAVVTGAGQGVGEAIAERLALEGASVVMIDLNLDTVSEAADRISGSTGCQTLAVRADITREEDVETAFQSAAEQFGKVDIVVSNAGILIAGAVEEFEVAKWRKVIDVNLVGYFVVAKAAAKVMIKQGGGGSIIQINSKSGKKGSFRNSAYAASKFGGIGLTQSLALELAPHNIRVNAICPGNFLDSPLWVDSLYDQYSKTQGLSKEEIRAKYEGQVPLGRGCSYDDLNNLLVFLASDQSSYMTGQAINVTGGQEMG